MIDITRAQKTEGWVNNSDLEWLAYAAQTRRRIVEVGSYKGKSTRSLGDHTPGMVLAIDDFFTGGDDDMREARDFMPVTEANLQDLISRRKVKLLRQSHDAPWPLAGYDPDMIFLDGAHDYATVHEQIFRAKSWLKAGGLLCGHDYMNGHHGVDKAVMELLPGYDFNPGGSIWWWIKEERNESLRAA